jgi:hypothetical protein
MRPFDLDSNGFKDPRRDEFPQPHYPGACAAVFDADLYNKSAGKMDGSGCSAYFRYQRRCDCDF